jgi:Fe-S cluster biogenesis protein NfuA
METQALQHIHIYTEASPNPNSMKFVLNLVLTPEGKDFNFTPDAPLSQSPLAEALFQNFSWISQVFILNNFITITRNHDEDWYALIPEIKPFLTTYFSERKPIFAFASEADMEAATETLQGETETERQIIQLLDEYVKPAVEGDGGAISFRSFQEGVVHLELRGSCSGCPSSTLTLKQGIQNLLTRMVPEVKEVVAVNM